MSLLSPQLEAFIAIAQVKTVHGAANTLNVTQTAVTQRIRALEAKLLTTLFIRTRRGMMLTPEGESLLRYCYAVREIEGVALANINNAAVDSSVRICISGPTSIMTSRVIPQCIPVMKKFSNLLMHFDINDIEERVTALRTGSSQFVILREEDLAPEMEYKILESERYVLVCTPEWKHRKLQDIIATEKIIDYDPTDQMTFDYLKHYSLFDIANHDRHFVNRTDSLAMLMMSGFGYGVLTSEFSKSYINNKQLIMLNSGKTFENTMVLAWYARHEPPKYFSALIQAMV
jgi:LysR family transcriptional regulator (chromosome initiation inhibitor)